MNQIAAIAAIAAGAFVAGLAGAPAAAQQLPKSTSILATDGKSPESLSSAAEDYGAAVAISGNYAFVAEPNAPLESGNVTVLERAQGEWMRVSTIQADPAELGDRFGSSIDADGDRVIIGTPGAMEGFGGAFVFRRQSTGDWTQEAVLTGEGLPRSSGFGQRTVAVAGNLAAVGTGFPGLGFIFEYDSLSGSWGSIGTVETDTRPPDWIAYKVSLSGERLAASAPYRNGQEGSVIVADRDPASGEGVVIGDFTVPGSFRFGVDLALSGDILAVGRRGRGDGGAGFIFEYDGSDWNHTFTWDFFSGGIDASGRRVIAGNVLDGTATVFRRDDAGVWTVDGVLSDGGNGVAFGSDVDISGDVAIVGDPRSTRPGAGRAFIFERDPGGEWEIVSETVGEGSVFPSIRGGTISCAAGKASLFPCNEIDLVSYVNIHDLLASGERMSDLWGWTDPDTGHEYAIATHSAGTTFIDVTDAENPVVLGVLPIHAGSFPAAWHDVKTYADHAFLVADGGGSSGMQIFDLTQLRSVTEPPVQFEETYHYNLVENVHNIAINEATGTAYLVGAGGTAQTCGGGLHVVNIADPSFPAFITCYADESTGSSGNGYTHDVECLVYDGPDPDYQGDEICFGSNVNAIQITSLADRVNPFAISVASYPGATYVHQGWLSDDGRYFYQNDELDENAENPFPRTFIWNVEDLDDPIMVATFEGTEEATDHNLFVKGGFLYQSNYVAGVRILDLADPERPVEVAYFDTAPAASSSRFEGSWASYPFFESGNIVTTSAAEGLFVLRPSLEIGTTSESEPEIPTGYSLEQNYPNPFNPFTQIRYSIPEATRVRLSIVDETGRTVAILVDREMPSGSHAVTWDASALASGAYHYRIQTKKFEATRSLFLLK